MFRRTSLHPTPPEDEETHANRPSSIVLTAAEAGGATWTTAPTAHQLDTETRLAIFRVQLEESLECGCVFLTWELWRLTLGATRAEVVNRLPLCVAGCLLPITLIAQGVVCAGLCYALGSETSGFTFDGRAFCPGQDAEEAEIPLDAQASGAACTTLAGLVLVLLVFLISDWVTTVKAFARMARAMEARTAHLGSTAAISVLQTVRLRRRGSVPTRALHHSIYDTLLARSFIRLYLDCFVHVLLTAVVYAVMIFAMFFITSVGVMVANVFSLMFLLEIDNQVKAQLLKYTDMATQLYGVFEEEQLTRGPVAHRRGLTAKALAWGQVGFFGLFYVVITVLYLGVVGVGVWAWAWTAKGCKPGSAHYLEFF